MPVRPRVSLIGGAEGLRKDRQGNESLVPVGRCPLSWGDSASAHKPSLYFTADATGKGSAWSDVYNVLVCVSILLNYVHLNSMKVHVTQA